VGVPSGESSGCDELLFPLAFFLSFIPRDLREGTVTAEALSSRNRREKEERIEEKASRSENEPYLFRIKFVPGREPVT
jgi:hypothetical protein